MPILAVRFSRWQVGPSTRSAMNALARQRDDLVVVAVLDVAQLLDIADLLAERLDVGEQLFLVGGFHGGTLLDRGSRRAQPARHHYNSPVCRRLTGPPLAAKQFRDP